MQLHRLSSFYYFSNNVICLVRIVRLIYHYVYVTIWRILKQKEKICMLV